MLSSKLINQSLSDISFYGQKSSKIIWTIFMNEALNLLFKLSITYCTAWLAWAKQGFGVRWRKWEERVFLAAKPA